ncbi:hypothetical protein [Dyella japonica]|uniref:Transmembrane protein n=1 Tax=Dyella japonica DSM 16301 TaxID=1440762 RepID=A0A0G9H3I8_9GAMM|nr:hypothetical protein [Dyella japonica]KLD64410.1 hypothetical protein Y882_07585 [Dyella japonica DSM 16301]
MIDDTGEPTDQTATPDDETQRRRALFDTYWTEQQTRERANRDKYDNTILAYSTGALALSVTFIKDVVPLATAQALWTLKTSWVLFATSLLLMLATFPMGAQANRASIDAAQEYFINCKDEYFNKQSRAGKTLNWLNPLAGFVFFAAVGFTVAFVWTNVHDKEKTDMTNQKAPPTTSTQALNEAHVSATMQVVHKGTPSAAMPAAAAPAPAPTPAPAAPPRSSK